MTKRPETRLKKHRETMPVDTYPHPVWRYIERDLAVCEQQLPALVQGCKDRPTKGATEEVCEMCRSTFGAFIDAEHFIRKGIDLSGIIEKFDDAAKAVAQVAERLRGADQEDVQIYARNIRMRMLILRRFESKGEESAIEYMDRLTRKLQNDTD